MLIHVSELGLTKQFVCKFDMTENAFFSLLVIMHEWLHRSRDIVIPVFGSLIFTSQIVLYLCTAVISFAIDYILALSIIIIIDNRFNYMNDYVAKNKHLIPLDLNILRGLYKWNLQVTLDPHWCTLAITLLLSFAVIKNNAHHTRITE